MTDQNIPPKEIEDFLLNLLDKKEDNYVQCILDIILKNIELKRFPNKEFFSYVTLVANNYVLHHGYIKKIQKDRDDDVWKDLLPRLYGWAYNYLLKKSFPPNRQTMETAQGYVSEASASIVNAHFPYDVEFDPWACVLVHNVCRRQMRKATRKSIIPENQLVPLVDELHTITGTNNFKERIELESMIEQLPKEEWQEIIRKLYFEGLSPAEIAKAKNQDVGTIYRLKYKALGELKKIWGLKGYKDE